MAVSPVILTRVRLPQRRKDILRRPRLLDVLHRNSQRKLTFVSAPAGYGKTALLLDFAHDLEATVCWYSISPEHTDLVTFVQHLTAALQQQFPNFGAQLTMTDSGVPDPYSLAITISNEMMAQVVDFCLIVLDDFHLVGEVQGIVSFVEALLENLPEQVRFVAASRSVYGIPTVNLYVHEEILTVGVKELRFRTDELQALVRQNYRVSLPLAQAAHLATLTDGWIMALLLAVRSVASGELPRLEGQTDQLYAFLAAEVLAQLPRYLQDFMLATSIFAEFNEALCQDVLGADSAPQWLEELVARNLFVVQIETSAGAAYQYHQLFADFLQSRLWTQTPQVARDIHQRAAFWFARREDWERSVAHLLAAGNRPDAARCMDTVAADLYRNGRTNLLETWGSNLSQPPRMIEAAPYLALYWAKVLIDRGEAFEHAESLLDLAEERLPQSGDVDQTANMLLTRSVLLRRQRKMTEALELARAAEKSLGDDRGYRWLQAQRMQGIVLARMDQLSAAIGLLRGAAAGFRQIQADNDLVGTLNDLTVTELESGDIFEAQNSALEAVQILRQKGGGLRLATSLNNAGYVLYQTGRYKDAWELYQECFNITQGLHSNEMLAYLLNSRADLLRDIDEWQLAEADYSAVLLLESSSDLSEAQAAAGAGLSQLHRLRGSFNEALHWLREATRYRKETPESPQYQLGIAAIYLDMGQPGLAQRAVESALAQWPDQTQSKQETVLAQFLLGQLLYAADSQRESLEQLSTALQRAAQLGYDQFLVVAGRRTRAWLGYAQATWPGHPQLDSLIERIDQFKTGLAAVVKQTQPVEPRPAGHLEIWALGPGLVRRDGETIPASIWKSVRSRALFFYICDRGQATKEELALAFWPDFGPEKVTSNFHATLWRVRRAVGQDTLVFDESCYSLSTHLTKWYDVADFEAFAKRGRDRTKSADERAEAWQQALALYQGPYLAGVEFEWVDERRRHLESLYREGLATTAKWELGRQHFEAARNWYQMLVAVDPYFDEAYAGLLESCVRAGSVAEARAIYQAYEQRLATELGARPSPRLQSILSGFT